MKTNIIKKSVFTVFLLALVLMLALIPLSTTTYAFAEGGQVKAKTISGMEQDGKYKVPTPNDIKVPFAKGFFDTTGYVEKIGDNYYFSYTVLTGNLIENWAMKLGGMNGLDGRNVGTVKTEYRATDPDTGKPAEYEGEPVYAHTYTYSLTVDDLTKDFYFTMNVMPKPMSGAFQDIVVTIDLAKAQYVGPVDNPTVERPAARVPVFNTVASNTEWEKGTEYEIPPATATLVGDEKEIPVTIEAYYIGDGKITPEKVDISSGKIKMEKDGLYQVTYFAQSDSQIYKTNLGNSASNKLVVDVVSKFGARGAGKVLGLPKGYKAVTGKAEKGSVAYNKASEKMAKIADKFEVISVALIDKAKKPYIPNKEYTLALSVNPEFDYHKIKVFHMDENGKLDKVPIRSNYSTQYVYCTTFYSGDFIICEEGVEYVMPMKVKGPLMLVGMLAGLAVIIVPIVIVVKNKKKKALASGTYNKKDKKEKGKSLNKDKKKK